MYKYDWIWEKEQGSNFQLAKYQPLRVHEYVLVFYNGKPTYNILGLRNGKPYRAVKKKLRKNAVETLSTEVGAGAYEMKYGSEGERYPESIIKFNRPMTGEHPTQKPVGLFEYLIRTYTNEGDLVFDGFGGSGTTAVAAHKSKRNFIVIEKEKKYFDLATRRLDNERKQLTMF